MPHAMEVRQPGGPEALVWREVEVGEPGPGEVRLRQTAVGLNFIDVYHRSGLYPQPGPFIPGVEGAGVVEAVGPGVEGLKLGDRVGYAGPIGAYAEVRLIAADRLVKLPGEIGDEQAAAMLLQGMTAHMLLRKVHTVQSGETILVHAAAGGVGTIMTQWAKVLGCTVIATVGSEAKAGVARANGADHVILYDREDVAARVKEITGGRGVRVSYDSVGAATVDASLNSLARRGWYVSFGNASGPVPAIEPLRLMRGGSLVLTRPTLLDFIATRADFEAAASAVFAVIASGQVKIQIGQRFALKDAAEAHRAMESRATIGASLLLP